MIVDGIGKEMEFVFYGELIEQKGSINLVYEVDGKLIDMFVVYSIMEMFDWKLIGMVFILMLVKDVKGILILILWMVLVDVVIVVLIGVWMVCMIVCLLGRLKDFMQEGVKGNLKVCILFIFKDEIG